MPPSSRWASEGIRPADIALLHQVRIGLADLGGAFLGLEGDNTILIDRTADGYGWFIDPTPIAAILEHKRREKSLDEPLAAGWW